MYQNTYKTKSEDFFNLERAAQDFTYSKKQAGAYPKTTKRPINHMTLGQFYIVNVTLNGQVCMLELL